MKLVGSVRWGYTDAGHRCDCEERCHLLRRVCHRQHLLAEPFLGTHWTLQPKVWPISEPEPDTRSWHRAADSCGHHSRAFAERGLCDWDDRQVASGLGPLHPMQQGFGEFLGMLHSDHPYYGEDPQNPVLRGYEPEPQPGTSPTLRTRGRRPSSTATPPSRSFCMWRRTPSMESTQATPDQLTAVQPRSRATSGAYQRPDGPGPCGCSMTAALRAEGLDGIRS